MQRTFDSQDFGPQTVAASSISEDGIDVVYRGLEEYETKFGEGKNCFVADILVGEEPKGLIFSSKRFATLLRKYEAEIMNQKIHICGFDTGQKRHYTITF